MIKSSLRKSSRRYSVTILLPDTICPRLNWVSISIPIIINYTDLYEKDTSNVYVIGLQ